MNIERALREHSQAVEELRMLRYEEMWHRTREGGSAGFGVSNGLCGVSSSVERAFRQTISREIPREGSDLAFEGGRASRHRLEACWRC